MKIDENQKYLLAIARAFGLSFSRFCKLRTFFAGDFKKCFLASVIDWQEATIDQKGIDKFFATRGQVSPDQELEKLQKCGGQMLICGEDNYPQQLTKIYSPPALLFLRGKILPTDFPSISVVGSRKISAYGKRACYAIVSHLSQQGITIVSGLAYGVDVLSHRTAVENGGRTIAVLGSAIDQITPQQNENFAKKFLAEGKGVILSEYLPGSVSRPEQFAIRNRIVTGLSIATIIIEGAQKSGSLISASLALEQNREVFAVPGEIFAKNSEGTNSLIFNGVASPALSGEQVLQTLGIAKNDCKTIAKMELPVSSNENCVLNVFENGEKLHTDQIVKLSKMNTSSVLSTLSVLELKGFLQNIGNQIFVKKF